jgi:hypothetical protein
MELAAISQRVDEVALPIRAHDDGAGKYADRDQSAVGGEQAIRRDESQRLRGPEIDHQLVLGRRLYRQVSRFLPPEDAIDVAGRAPELIVEIGPIGDQPAGFDEVPLHIDRRQFVLGRASRSNGDDRTLTRSR